MRFSLVMWNAVFWRALWNVADMCLKTVTHVCLRVFENSNLLYTSLKRATCEWSLHVSENSSLCMEFTCVWKQQPVYGVYMCLKTATCEWSLHVSENSSLCMEFTRAWKDQLMYGVYMWSEKSNPCMEFTVEPWWKADPLNQKVLDIPSAHKNWGP